MADTDMNFHFIQQKYFTEKFASKNISDATYELYPIENVLEVKDLLKANHEICGLNVTIPHKQSVIPLLHALDDDAKQIGAVNCISIKNNLLKGFNTDAPAFEFCLIKYLQPHHKQALVLGNGGSAADAQHLAAEFSGRFYKDRKALPSEALHCNTSYLTAVANDYSYDVIYSRLLEGLAKPGDVLVGLSTSGNSGNIVKAFEKSKELKVTTIGFTGAAGGKMKEVSDYLINVPSTDTPRIQESHILVGHIICELVEKNIFG